MALSLRLTDEQREAVRRKFPVAPDGELYVDAVFEGGGVKGPAFLGALRCFDDAGIRMRKVAGTSAGALTAAAIASGMRIGEMEDAIGALEFRRLLSEKTSRLVLNGRPDNDLDNMGRVLANLVAANVRGQYSTRPLVRWARSVLAGRLDTFGQLRRGGGAPWHERRDLRIVVSDISRGEMAVLPNDLPRYGLAEGDFQVAEAVRLSMSIPLFFEPGDLGGSTIVDGGILSNFPLWLYDAPAGEVPDCPTIGFQLTEAAEPPRECSGAIGILAGVIHTMTVARDRQYVREHDHRRIVRIPADGVSATQFGIGDVEKDGMYAAGYMAARRFLIEEWDWDAYLAARATV